MSNTIRSCKCDEPKIIPKCPLPQKTTSYCPPKASMNIINPCNTCDNGDLDTNIMEGKHGNLQVLNRDGRKVYTGIPYFVVNFHGHDKIKGGDNPSIDNPTTYLGEIIEHRSSFNSPLDGSTKMTTNYYRLKFSAVKNIKEGGWMLSIKKLKIRPDIIPVCKDGVLHIPDHCGDPYLEEEDYATLFDGIDGRDIIKGTLPLDAFGDFCSVIDKMVTKSEDTIGELFEGDDCGNLKKDEYIFGDTYKTEDCKIGSAFNKEELLKEILHTVKTCKGRLFNVTKHIDNCGKTIFCTEVLPQALDGLVRINVPALTQGSGTVIANDKIISVQTLKETIPTKKLTPACPTGVVGDNCSTCPTVCADNIVRPFVGTLSGNFPSGTNQTYTFSNSSHTGTINGTVTNNSGVLTIVGTIKGNMPVGNLNGTVYNSISTQQGTVAGVVSAPNEETVCERASYTSDIRFKTCDVEMAKDGAGNPVITMKDKYSFDPDSFIVIDCSDGCKKKVYAKDSKKYRAVGTELVLDGVVPGVSPFPLKSFGAQLGNATLNNNIMTSSWINFDALDNPLGTLNNCEEWVAKLNIFGRLGNGAYSTGEIHLNMYFRFSKDNGATWSDLPFARDGSGNQVNNVPAAGTSTSFPGGSEYNNQARAKAIDYSAGFLASGSGNRLQAKFEAIFPTTMTPASNWSICFQQDLFAQYEYEKSLKPNCTITPPTC